MRKDPAVNDAIDIVGVHGPAWGGYPTPDALALSKPLWDSEGHFDEHPGWPEMARNINRNYIAGKVTATVFWPIISAMYDNLPYDDIGLIKSNQPWSGHYVVTPSVWVMAHTAQFTQPGWQYLDSAWAFSPRIPPARTAAMSLCARQTAKTSASSSRPSRPSLPRRPTSPSQASPAQESCISGPPTLPPAIPRSGSSSKQTSPPSTANSLSTCNPAAWSRSPPPPARPVATPSHPPPRPSTFPTPTTSSPTTTGRLAKYFSDMYGAFETTPCDGGRTGVCLSQLVPKEPIYWKRTDNRPLTILGNLDWTDYTVSTDVLFEQHGSVDLIGRLTGMSGSDIPNSYVLRVADTGAWSLRRTSTHQDKRTRQSDTVLAAGMIDPLGVKQWHRVSLAFNGSSIVPQIDGKPVTIYGKPMNGVTDATYAKGMVGLGALNYGLVQFDNFQIAPAR